MTTRSRYTAVNDKPWWLAGGISPAQCIMAFRAKGADSTYHAQNNLANLTAVKVSNNTTYIPWSKDNGWMFNKTARFGILQAASTTVYPGTMDNSWIIKISNVSNDYSAAMHPFYLRYSSFIQRIQISATTGYLTFYNVSTAAGTYYASTITPIDGVYAFAGKDIFINDAYIASVTPTSVAPGWVGAAIGGSNAAPTFAGYVQAFATYNVGLSHYQVAALTDAMNAL